jgi:hypothetical protein
MIELPPSNRLPIDLLTSCFNDVTNSYKFYWFLSILEQVRQGEAPLLPLNRLLAEMVASVWYPANYFYLSFGKQDRLSQIVQSLANENELALDSPKRVVIETVLGHLAAKTALGREIASLGQYVPYRFLRPFFSHELRGKPDWQVNDSIVKLADNAFTNQSTLSLYRFVRNDEQFIEIQRDWVVYLQQHLAILAGFSLWHLLTYLQRNNPNVPNVAGKLFEPDKRNLTKARQFWQLAMPLIGDVHCIYSGNILSTDFSLDHFLPWRFVNHDLLWNLIPVPKPINSAKGDNLPSMQRYFDRFAQLQFKAVQGVIRIASPRLLEDYTVLLKQEHIADIAQLSFEGFRTMLHDTIAPQIQIARNMGFVADWSYTTL